ncbi:hypothetical protein [Corynebacterium glaucum]|uniref:hypothetical protein n=1 Tax=Corynebacterium glaucum TaxID=187491 RepID=UPI0026590D9B|nr:hypothetical protein [Corynebacterium glaucum]
MTWLTVIIAVAAFFTILALVDDVRVRRLDTRGRYTSPSHTERRDEELYQHAISLIPEIDRMVAQLRTPLAAGVTVQWQEARNEIAPMPRSKRRRQVNAAMRSARRLIRIHADCRILAAFEQGDLHARLTVLESLDRDLRYAQNACQTSSLAHLQLRDALVALSHRVRALYGVVDSHQFENQYLAALGDYRALLQSRSAESLNQGRIPPLGSWFYVFGCGHGLEPWMWSVDSDAY